MNYHSSGFPNHNIPLTSLKVTRLHCGIPYTGTSVRLPSAVPHIGCRTATGILAYLPTDACNSQNQTDNFGEMLYKKAYLLNDMK